MIPTPVLRLAEGGGGTLPSRGRSKSAASGAGPSASVCPSVCPRHVRPAPVRRSGAFPPLCEKGEPRALSETIERAQLRRPGVLPASCACCQRQRQVEPFQSRRGKIKMEAWPPADARPGRRSDGQARRLPIADPPDGWRACRRPHGQATGLTRMDAVDARPVCLKLLIALSQVLFCL